LLWRILTPRPLGLFGAIIEALYLLATLNLFKSLIQSWRAARRIWRLAEPPVPGMTPPGEL
jgi:hypothetical protein